MLTALDLYDIPKDVKDAEKLMQEDLKLKERIVNQIALAEVAADNFMNELRQQKPEDSFEISPATKDYITMLSLLNGILTETGNTCFTIGVCFLIHWDWSYYMYTLPFSVYISTEDILWDRNKTVPGMAYEYRDSIFSSYRWRKLPRGTKRHAPKYTV